MMYFLCEQASLQLSKGVEQRDYCYIFGDKINNIFFLLCRFLSLNFDSWVSFFISDLDNIIKDFC